MFNCLFLVFALLAIPVHLEEYDVLVLPLSNVLRNKILEVFLLPHTFIAQDRIEDQRLDMEHFDEPTEKPDVDHYDYAGQVDMDETLNYDDKKTLRWNNIHHDDDHRLRIVGGDEVEIGMHPYHVGYGHNCAGAILGSKWVITCAHCGKMHFVRSGSKYLSRGKKTEIKVHHVHPMWGGSPKDHSFDYDFQILELKQHLQFDINTQPIKIGHEQDIVYGKEVTVTGWGNIAQDGPYSAVLRAVKVPIVTKETCQRVPFPFFQGTLTPRMFCAGYRDGRKDACQGDSGGPAVAHDRLLGIVSFGYGCATPDAYGVYSMVVVVRSWVSSITNINLN